MIRNMFMKLWKEEEGQDLLEYALLLVLIVLVAAAAVNPLGQTIANIYNNANNCAKTPTSC